MTGGIRTEKLRKRAYVLSVVTVLYNIVEGVVSIVAGAMAGSIALAGFGIDSMVESLSGGIMIWRFSRGTAISPEEEETIEARAERLIGVTFLIFGAYIAWESLGKLIGGSRPAPSLIGIIIAVVSLITMPVLFILKYRTGKEMGSRSLIADSKETLACMFLSVSLLIGLGMHYLYGLWWADPAVGLVIVVFLFREGYEIIRGEDDDDD